MPHTVLLTGNKEDKVLSHKEDRQLMNTEAEFLPSPYWGRQIINK